MSVEMLSRLAPRRLAQSLSSGQEIKKEKRKKNVMLAHAFRYSAILDVTRLCS